MKFSITEASIPDVRIIDQQSFGDYRGWFMETWSDRDFIDAGINCRFVQDNHSFTAAKGTLRGLHFQNNPMAQCKLVRCLSGAIMDVVIDFRKNSPTYKKWAAIELSSDNKRQLLIPRGFGHAFLTLTDNVEFAYKCDNYYSKEHDRSVKYNDPSIGINWGIDSPILSEKDINAPLLEDSDCNFVY